jgi:SAM-dependent methyltransferase
MDPIDRGTRRQRFKDSLDRLGLLGLAFALRQAAHAVRPRVLRHWNTLPNVEVHGVDPNGVLTEWCQANRPFAHVRHTSQIPELPYPKDFFDAVYCISVFTHLATDAQQAWVAELERVLRPGGLLSVTTHGAVSAERLGAAHQREFSDAGVVALHEVRHGSNLCAVYHSENYMRANFAPAMEVVDFLPLALRWSTHDITVFRKQ